MRRARWLVLCLAAALSVTLAACADDDVPVAGPSDQLGEPVGSSAPATTIGSAPTTEGPVTPSDTSGPPAPPTMPTEGVDAGVPYGSGGELVRGADEMYALSTADRDFFQLLQYELTERCLAAEGYDYQYVVVEESTAGSGISEFDENLGLVRAESADFGYKGDPQIEYGSSGASRLDVQMTEEISAALDECVIAAASEAPDDGEARLPWEIKHAAEADAAADPAFLKAQDEWAACMAEEGFDYARPTEPRHNFGECTSCKPTEEEYATVRADMECKARTDLIAIYRRARWDAQERRIQDNLPELESGLKTAQAALAEAQALLGELE